jgi:hypothetical protein
MRVNAVRQSNFLFAARLEKSRDPRDVLRTSSRGQTGANGATHQPPMFRVLDSPKRDSAWNSMDYGFASVSPNAGAPRGLREKKECIPIFSL